MAQTKKWLFKPLNYLKINQRFGENKACIPINGGSVITCDGLNPPKGYRSIYSTMKGHNGLDLHAPTYTPIYSAQDGWVEELVAEEARGLGIGIITDRKFWCNETGKEEHFKIRYWHNYANLVALGDKVKIGQHIALADNSGYSSGSHLHFEIKPVKISKTGKVTNILQDNGFYGAVEPEQYLLKEKASLFTLAKDIGSRLTIALRIWLAS